MEILSNLLDIFARQITKLMMKLLFVDTKNDLLIVSIRLNICEKCSLGESNIYNIFNTICEIQG